MFFFLEGGGGAQEVKWTRPRQRRALHSIQHVDVDVHAVVQDPTHGREIPHACRQVKRRALVVIPGVEVCTIAHVCLESLRGRARNPFYLRHQHVFALNFTLDRAKDVLCAISFCGER